MPGNFLEWLIVFLIVALLGKEMVWPIVAAKFGFKLPQGDGSEDVASLRNDFQQLLTGQQTLSTHFNHTTTAQWDEVKDSIREHNAMLANNRDVLMEMNRTFRELKEYGIKCRKD